MKKLVLYDVDQTLVDSKASILARCNDASQALGFGSLKIEDLSSTWGLTGDERLIYLFGKERFEEAKKFYRSGKTYSDLIILETGVIETLDYLVRQNIERGIVTNRTEGTLKECFEYTGLMKYFLTEFVFVPKNDGKPNHFFMNTFAKGKPNPEGLLLALSMNKVEPSEAIYVGDAIEDMQAAKNAGILFVGYKPTVDCPYKIEDHREIIDFLNE